ncbi:MAG: exodeoxyribonuclease V subunit beta [Pseudomonadota bacterium]|nr:exodeoxyribonuclease V subunit beta [Pseudomonadota bacterium]
MSAARPLVVEDLPLSGIRLIEASAGTGKTYTICGLYLRLIVEAGRGVDQVLVVTFTKAATAELRDRLRARLTEARAAFVTGESADPLCRTLLQRHADRALALRRLEAAIRGFDQAAVYTIHSFCQRILADHAFDSAMPFDAEVIADDRDLVQAVVDDHWRRHLDGVGAGFAAYLSRRGVTPDQLAGELRQAINFEAIDVLGGEQVPDLEAAEARLDRAYRATRQRWHDGHDTIRAQLTDPDRLNQNTHKRDRMATLCGSLQRYFLAATDPVTASLPEGIDRLEPDRLQRATKKKATPPDDPFFTALAELISAAKSLESAYEASYRAHRYSLLTEAGPALRQRKRRLGLQSYNDMVLDLHHALSGSAGGASLAGAVRRRYPVALIDEFQDTDPSQYGIFRRIYGEAAGDSALFLVGDPKQAIYSFRGADIFAYLQARRDVGEPDTLSTNWRSVPALVQAVNAVFREPPSSFLFEGIPFYPARAAEKSHRALIHQGKSSPPMTLWRLPHSEGEKPWTKDVAADLSAQATAEEVARLLNDAQRGKVRIGDRLLQGQDIAILVLTHQQGEAVSHALRRKRVPHVRYAQDNVFATAEADELECLLRAVVDPARESLVRAALGTDLLGWNADDIYRLAQDEQHWEDVLDGFRGHQQRWVSHGFMRMYQHCLTEHRTIARLLAQPDGERRVTNLLHLGELLQAQASRQALGIDALLKWFDSRRLGAASGDEEEALLRLESDENLVRVVTIHKSKGLQYPVVFCPFLWSGKRAFDKATSVSFHAPSQPPRRCLDLGSERFEEHRELAEAETFAERLRLAYVALTRAESHCYLLWGRVNQAELSPLAWLLHARPDTPTPTEAASRFKNLDEAAIDAELGMLAEVAEGCIEVAELPVATATVYEPLAQSPRIWQARQLQHPVAPAWRTTSFSALAAGGVTETAADFDALSAWGEADRRAAPALDIHGFPRGMRAGRCLHAIFEHWDFQQSDRSALDELVGRQLSLFGFGSEWTGAVGDMVQTVLKTGLPGGIRLAGVARARRLDELEFHFPIGPVGLSGFRRTAARHGMDPARLPADGDPARAGLVHGFMKGFIDLVFELDGRYYLADYKSNWLGPRAHDYRPESVDAAMVAGDYVLQYLIYAVALQRYLRQRLADYRFETHFGGVYYLFLRGMGTGEPSKHHGVFFHRPGQQLLDALDAYLQQGGIGP